MVTNINNSKIITFLPVADSEFGGGETSKNTSNSTPKIDFVDKNKQKICKKYGLTPEQYDQLIAKYPNFLNSSRKEQVSAIKEITNPIISEQNTETKQPESTPVAKNNKKETSISDFNYNKYNSLNREEKVVTCYNELAKNTYIYGYKGSDGVINVPANGKEAWDNLSDKEKQEYVKTFKENVSANPKFEEFKNKINENTSNDDSIDKTRTKSELNDSMVRTIQVANSLNMSLADFLKLDEGARIDATEAYLKEAKQNGGNLSGSDINYLTHQKEQKEFISSALKNKGITDFNEQNISTSELYSYADDNNINLFEENYNYLIKKSENNPEALSDVEKNFLKEFKPIMESEAGREAVKKTNIAGANKIQKSVELLDAKIQKGEQLSAEEQKSYDRMTQYLATDEAKILLEQAQYLPKPENDYEKEVLSDINNLKSEIRGTFNSDVHEYVHITEYLKNKTAGMSEEDRQKYYDTFLKFNNDVSTIFVLQDRGKVDKTVFRNKHVTAESGYVLSNDSDLATADAVSNLSQANTENAKSDNPYLKNQSFISQNCLNSAMAEKDGYSDEAINISTQTACDMAQYYDTEQSDTLMCTSADASTRIKDEKLQAENIAYRQKSPAYSDTCAKHDIDILDKYHENNRYDALNGATDGRAEVTAYATENDAVAKLGAKDQERGYSLLQNRVNEYFKGDDANKYSSALANQIKNCDASVQAKLVDQVYASGNKSAIETVISNVGKYAPVADTQITQSIINAISGVGIDDELTKKIQSGEVLTLQEYNSLTPSEKLEYKTNYFYSLTSTKQINLLVGLSASSDKKRIYEEIASTNKELLIKLIEHDANTAQYIYDHIAGNHELVKNIANRKSSSANEFIKLLSYIENKKDTEALAYDIKNSGNPKTSITLNQYADNPIDKYALFRDDKYKSYLKA